MQESVRAARPRARPSRPSSLVMVRRIVDRREVSIFIVSIALFAYFALSAPGFLNAANMAVISQFMAPSAVIGAGLVVLLVCGEVDLSAGTAFVFIPFVTYYAMSAGIPFLLAVLISLAVAAAIGAVNGFITVFLRVPAFVATLGVLFAVNGVMLLTSGGQAMPFLIPGTLGDVFGGWAWSELIWALLIVAVFYLILHHSRFGLHTSAAGGNLTGARESGVFVRSVKLRAFILCSIFAGLIGIVDAGRISTLEPGNNGTLTFFYAISAAVIGGTALTGGRGTILGALIGALVLGILYDGLNVQGVSAYAFQLILGLAVLLSMIAGTKLREVSARSRRAT